MFSARHPEELVSMTRELGPRASTGTTRHAAEFGTDEEAFATASAAADGTLERLTGLIEQGLGYRPFPSQWASLPLPELRVSYLKREQPTLLTSLLSDHLENLP